jgi:hypothetical protein
MFFENLLLPGVLFPGACAAAVLWLAARLDRRRRASTVGGGAAALGLAYLSTHVALTGWPSWPPVDSTQRLLFLVLAAAFLSAVRGWLMESAPPWWLRLGFIFLLLLAMLKTPLEHAWSGGEAVLWLAVLLAVGFGLARSLALDMAGATAWVPAGVRVALLCGVAVALGLSGTARLALLAGALACAVGVVEVLAARLLRQPWLAADSWVLAMAVLGLLLGGYFYAALEPWPGALLVVALLLPGVVAKRPLPWRLLPLVPLALALAIVIAGSLAEEEDPYGYYGSSGSPGAVAPGGNIALPAA